MDDNFSDFRLFYELNKDKFPADFRGTVEEFAEMATFYYEVYLPCAERMIPQLKRLLFKQYPDLKGAMHPSQLKYIEEIVETTPFSLVYGMKRLLKEQRESTHPSLPSEEGNATREAGAARTKVK